MKIRRMRHARYTHQTGEVRHRAMWRLLDGAMWSVLDVLKLCSAIRPVTPTGTQFNVIRIRRPVRYVEEA